MRRRAALFLNPLTLTRAYYEKLLGATLASSQDLG